MAEEKKHPRHKISMPEALVDLVAQAADTRHWTRAQTLRFLLVEGLRATGEITQAQADELAHLDLHARARKDGAS